LIIRDRDEDELDAEMDEKKYDRKPLPKKGKARAVTTEDAEEEDAEDAEGDAEDEKGSSSGSGSGSGSGAGEKATFDYMLDMKARSLNIRSRVYKNLEKEWESLKQQIAELEGKTPERLWLDELAEFKAALLKWLPVADENGNQDVEGGGKGKGKGKKAPPKNLPKPAAKKATARPSKKAAAPVELEDEASEDDD
jgi:hypothetical protein